jgi:hypothetical protein
LCRHETRKRRRLLDILTRAQFFRQYSRFPRITIWPGDCFGRSMPIDCTEEMGGHEVAATDLLLERFRSEIRHAPGLALTLAQTARLFNLELDACQRLIAALAQEGLLYVRPDGRVVPIPPQASKVASHSSSLFQ